MLLAILVVQQFERDAMAAELAMNPRAVRLGTMPFRNGHLGALIQHRLELVLGQTVHARPASQAGSGSARQHVVDRAWADAHAARGVSVGEQQLPLQTKNLSGLAHGHSLRGHRSSFGGGGPEPTPSSLSPVLGGHCVRSPMPDQAGAGDHDPVEPTITMGWTR